MDVTGVRLFLNKSSADEYLQLGASSVNSVPSPNSISKKPYSHVEADTELAFILVTYEEVSECVADEMVDRVVNVAVVVAEGGVVEVLLQEFEDDAVPCDCTVVKVPLMATDADVDEAASTADVTDTGTAVAGLAGGSMEKMSLLFNGSKADCEDRLNTELQLIDLVDSSSAKPESLSDINELEADVRLVQVVLAVVTD